MSIASGYKKFKKYILTSSGFQLVSHWTKANTLEFDDGKTAQDKLGAIDGISSSRESNSDKIAASTALVSELNSDLGGFQFSVASDGTPTYKPGGADTAYPFNSGMQKIVSVSTYCKFIGYDKTVFVSIVFDISKCKLMITTNINNSWFQYLYALSSTTSLPGDSVLSPNKNYDLSNYNYLRLTFNLPTGNYDGSNSTSLGTIQFK